MVCSKVASMAGSSDDRTFNDLHGFLDEDLVGDAVANMFGKSNKPCSFFRVGIEHLGLVVSYINIFPEVVRGDHANIRGLAGKNFNGSTPIEGLHSSAVHDKTDVEEDQQPSVAWNVEDIHDPLDVVLDILVTTFGIVLPLHLWFTRPVVNRHVLQDSSCFLANLRLRII